MKAKTESSTLRWWPRRAALKAAQARNHWSCSRCLRKEMKLLITDGDFCAFVPLCLCAFVPLCLCAFVVDRNKPQRHKGTKWRSVISDLQKRSLNSHAYPLLCHPGCCSNAPAHPLWPNQQVHQIQSRRGLADVQPRPRRHTLLSTHRDQ